MIKTLLIIVLVYAGYRLFINVRTLQNTKPNKTKKADYKNLDIQDADYTDLDEE